MASHRLLALLGGAVPCDAGSPSLGAEPRSASFSSAVARAVGAFGLGLFFGAYLGRALPYGCGTAIGCVRRTAECQRMIVAGDAIEPVLAGHPGGDSTVGRTENRSVRYPALEVACP